MLKTNTTAAPVNTLNLLGCKVRLPDGEEGIVTAAGRGTEIEVLQPQKTLGRGPWIFDASQVTVI